MTFSTCSKSDPVDAPLIQVQDIEWQDVYNDLAETIERCEIEYRVGLNIDRDCNARDYWEELLVKDDSRFSQLRHFRYYYFIDKGNLGSDEIRRVWEFETKLLKLGIEAKNTDDCNNLKDVYIKTFNVLISELRLCYEHMQSNRVSYNILESRMNPLMQLWDRPLNYRSKVNKLDDSSVVFF
ncbi:MAG: hypothetical protein OXC03_01155 [Flavobacteriaceae bacterium]|nr:hypothetical protein [Flavobacteriaceae bacterium]